MYPLGGYQGAPAYQIRKDEKVGQTRHGGEELSGQTAKGLGCARLHEEQDALGVGELGAGRAKVELGPHLLAGAVVVEGVVVDIASGGRGQVLGEVVVELPSLLGVVPLRVCVEAEVVEGDGDEDGEADEDGDSQAAPGHDHCEGGGGRSMGGRQL